MKTATLLISLSAALGIGLFSGCENAGPNTGEKAAIGAATGAVIGGVIGHQSGEEGEGAALGAAAGGLAGAAYGNKQDREHEAKVNNEYPSDYYLSLMTPDEVATLQARARASGRSDYKLTDFLTDQEKANLRARAEQQRNREIGN